MLIGLDFDGTWTADPDFWRDFVASALRRSHGVVMVTGRNAWSDDMERGGLPKNLPIVYAGASLKQQAALKAGYKVDVWIDDMPGTIQQQLVIGDQSL